MKVVLFCGGKGSRIRGHSYNTPKPLVPVNGLPIILRLMAQYSAAGHKDFLLAAGYKMSEFDAYFELIRSNKFINLFDDILREQYKSPSINTWNISIIDTGEESCIGERLFYLKDYLLNEKKFFLNYSDIISDIKIDMASEYLDQSNAVLSVAATSPKSTFHWLNFEKEDNTNKGYVSKISYSSDINIKINAGYMCTTNDIFNFIKQGEELVEEPFKRLSEEKKLLAYDVNCYWQPVDTLADLKKAEKDLENQGFDTSLGRLVKMIYA